MANPRERGDDRRQRRDRGIVDTERWQRIEELYHAALERPEHEREAFLSESAADAELANEVRSLLGG